MRHIIAILLQNEAGALSRVAGLFSTRGYNIESLSVAPTDDPTVSRITLVTTGSEAVIQQILNQLNKLIDGRGPRLRGAHRWARARPGDGLFRCRADSQ
jgi:acetolactate synthase-1/3 small subunit